VITVVLAIAFGFAVVQWIATGLYVVAAALMASLASRQVETA
jgi:uncharacterized membrane protein (DUF485 family)